MDEPLTDNAMPVSDDTNSSPQVPTPKQIEETQDITSETKSEAPRDTLERLTRLYPFLHLFIAHAKHCYPDVTQRERVEYMRREHRKFHLWCRIGDYIFVSLICVALLATIGINIWNLAN
ncbi:MAG: hypothetical protein E7Z96_02485 [Actinomycetaceae bacterium]|nr:hypothetical protein [Actinomycetaceae bacterium]